MDNRILNHMYEVRGGCYCHALEVSDPYEIECAVEQIYADTQRMFGNDMDHREEVIFFFETMWLHYLPEEGEENPETEKAVHDFNFRKFVYGLN